MDRIFIFWALFFNVIISSGQLAGNVYDRFSHEPLYNVRIDADNGQKTATNFEGGFELSSTKLPVKLIFRAPNYLSDTIYFDTVGQDIVVLLTPITQLIGGIVVSANRRSQQIENLQISLDILPSDLIRKKGFLDLEDAVNQTSGVFSMEGQVSIRGGGGYAYGVGSRTQLLMDGIPLTSPDRGDVKWNSIPLENIQNIEVIKGVSSVLYGSGALNGVIALTSKVPSQELKSMIKFQTGVYDNPSRSSLKWWNRSPTFQTIDYVISKGKNESGNSLNINGAFIEGYRMKEKEGRVRVNGNSFIKPFKNKNHQFGLNYGVQFEDVSSFILWQSDSLAYNPQVASDGSTSLTRQKSIRLNVDPNYKFKDKSNGIHNLRTRYYLVTTGNETSFTYAALANLIYQDYNYSKSFHNHRLIAGFTNVFSAVDSYVFGKHSSFNTSFYGQYELNKERLNFTAGLRLEYFQQDDCKPDSEFQLGPNDYRLPIYPIVRTGLHYKIAKYTHFRTSFGNGIRFPSVAERYAYTSNGGVFIFPNPELESEVGWSGEFGVRQLFKVSDWKGSIDIAFFINRYNEMIEFTFGIYNPDSISLTTDPSDIGYINNWAGFQAKNSEKAEIKGIEISTNGYGDIGKIGLSTLIGYTYMNPISRNTDENYLMTFSDSSNILKYRFSHLFKADLELSYKFVSLGISARYNSYMRNIDALFEDGVFGVQILPGLKNYRLENQNGDLVFDGRIIFNLRQKHSISLIVNNFLNNEYSSRPALIQPPRSFAIQFVANFD